ncbi:hypothetical protein ANN_03607 [Periplaneta americana]|uniref:Uncharacterized protein n=1 Tax=Periplaneta americana TaxID=6978 RepID=A0ABQ8U195_PERAM|nr:hypothetical protein ANN_03607 [Periplaneta americana]
MIIDFLLVFVRELISNASDALEKLRYLSLTGEVPEGPDARSLEIHIATDKQNRTLTIQEPPKCYIPRSLDWQGWAGTVATSITGPNPTGFLLWGDVKRFVYETPIDTAEDLVALVVEAEHVIRDNVGLFERCRHSIVRSCFLKEENSIHVILHQAIPNVDFYISLVFGESVVSPDSTVVCVHSTNQIKWCLVDGE